MTRFDPTAVVSPATRKVMQGNKGKGTRPEMVVRRLVHGMGYRYRLHRKGLPGSPDLVFPGRRKVIFVHGCFWHAHGCKVAGRPVTTRADFWGSKFGRNKARDARVVAELEAAGWSCLVLWECEVRDLGETGRRVQAFLGKQRWGAGTIGPQIAGIAP